MAHHREDIDHLFEKAILYCLWDEYGDWGDVATLDPCTKGGCCKCVSPIEESSAASVRCLYPLASVSKVSASKELWDRSSISSFDHDIERLTIGPRLILKIE